MYAVLYVYGILLLPIAVLIVIGGMLSALWLIFLGEWSAILIGTLIFFFASIAILIVAKPSKMLCRYSRKLHAHGKIRTSLLFSFASIAYDALIISALAASILHLFFNMSTPETFLPLIALSFSLSFGPWLLVAMVQFALPGNTSIFAAGMGAIGYIIASLAIATLGIGPREATCIISAFLILSVPIGVAINNELCV